MATTVVTLVTLGVSSSAQAALITFDDVIFGSTSYSFDGDNDGIDDVIFSTSDPLGFNTAGPGSNMTYIQEPGLEGTSELPVDIRVDFLVGATDFLKFSFALNSFSQGPTTFTSFNVYDKNHTLLASDFEYGIFTSPNGISPSNYPEGLIETSFSGVAAYATFNFSSESGRYIIDNFEGTFGTTEMAAVPEPTSMLGLLSFGAVSVFLNRKRK